MLNGKYICMPPDSMLNKNVAVYGASGSMKTRAYCLNRILQATVPGPDGQRESLIICDPKSELYEKTSEYLRKTHTVKAVSYTHLSPRKKKSTAAVLRNHPFSIP